MKTGKRVLSMAAVLAIAATSAVTLTACSGSKTDTTTIRYLNFKPEIADKYKELATAYEKETGVKVVVETAANNKYEETLTAKMSTDEAPTLFQINGPKGYANWKDYCADLSDSELYQHLTDKSLARTAKYMASPMWLRATVLCTMPRSRIAISLSRIKPRLTHPWRRSTTFPS